MIIELFNMSETTNSTDFLKQYKDLEIPEGLSKSKRGQFEGVITTIQKVVDGEPLNATRAKNIASAWSKIMENDANTDVYEMAIESGFDQALWNHFAKVGGVNFTKIIDHRKERKDINVERKKYNGAYFIGHVRLTIGEEEECDDGNYRYSLTTVPVNVPCEGCSLRKFDKGVYGFTVPSHILERFFEGSEEELTGDHVFRVEWKPSRRKKGFYDGQVKALADDIEPDILPYPPRRGGRKKGGSNKHKIVHRDHYPMTVSMNEDGSYRVTTPPFKLKKAEDGRMYFLSRVGENLYGFKSIPANVMNDLFDEDTEITGKHTFEVLWRMRKAQDGDHLYSVLGCLADDVETTVKYVDPKKFHKKKNGGFTRSVQETIAMKKKNAVFSNKKKQQTTSASE